MSVVESEERLFRWLRKNGAKCEGVHFKNNEHGVRGLFCERDVDSIDLFIPKRLMLTEKKVKSSQIGKAISSTGFTFKNTAYFASYLLNEKRKAKSFWRPFLDVLPSVKDVSNFPIFYSDETLNAISCSSLWFMANSILSELKSEYAALLKYVDMFDFSYEEYKWACTMYRSRSFTHTLIGKTTAAMVPLHDMMNHSSIGKLCSYGFSISKGGFEMKYGHPLKAGEELKSSYCDQKYASTYLKYGFFDADFVNLGHFCGFLSIPNELLTTSNKGSDRFAPYCSSLITAEFYDLLSALGQIKVKRAGISNILNKEKNVVLDYGVPTLITVMTDNLRKLDQGYFQSIESTGRLPQSVVPDVLHLAMEQEKSLLVYLIDFLQNDGLQNELDLLSKAS